MSLSLLQYLVDCEWEEWKVGECSKTCGGGHRTNTRSKRIREAHGGLECSGSATITEQCNVKDCPSKSWIRKVFHLIIFHFLMKLTLLRLINETPIPHFKQSIAYGINGKLVSVPRHVEEGSFSLLEISPPKQRMEEKIVLETHPLFKIVTLKHVQVS